ncbi:TPA: enoyl-CoA hydratase/isomerase family protein [Burkholderia cepacia]|uniref:Enoyl-CoA hydratase/isomerase family protein n=1 Tax=Medicago truncatula TaxID=3880 RepID=A0A072TNI5_MEDTR|nr:MULTISPECIES: enoyl-CoA hydratase/isomerase family protein [Burkholderia]KEH15150.1 enoyl-CoA hydratase/isomerase family protein [Medicago truncatula]HDR9760493.1 enoyl-CoA hydratase/isomerase family protein [Burkholderia cepacia ATCC 25416]EMD9439064.1 enoyl-CoA hydratase/isomerase family protein [Burkholderia cepacia]KVX52256.1 enoyl-CoA hydratase [Burkholderia cepacia]KWD55082.1 enoyl-CoA hydratase [Burkholderia cepacia]
MLLSEHQEAVNILTIDRPRRRNALGTDLICGLKTALRDAEANDEVRAIVLTGTEPGFCAGSDLKELGNMSMAEMREHEAVTAALARSISMLRKPVLCAVSGFALGGGVALAAACDLVVTTATCRWHMPEVKIGWIPPWGLEFLLGRCTPATARRLAWGVEAIDGAEAQRLGLADYVTQEASALPMALEVANTLASYPLPAVVATKRYFRDSFAAHGEIRDAEANLLFAENCEHPVAKATLNAFGVKA